MENPIASPQQQATPYDLNLRKAESGEPNCSQCANWGLDGTCAVLQIPTTRVQICDAYAPIEDTPPANDGDSSMLMNQLFG